MERDIKNSIDVLLDAITNAAFNADLNLADTNDFEVRILLEIYRSKNYVFARIFRYEGDVE